jgi:hypothetical protein
MEESGRTQEDQDFKEILEKLEDGKMMEMCLNSPEWKPWRKAWKYLAKQAKETLLTVNPDDKTQILRLQLQAQWYDSILENTIKQYRLEAEEAYEAAKDRGWIDSVLRYLQKPVGAWD